MAIKYLSEHAGGGNISAYDAPYPTQGGQEVTYTMTGNSLTFVGYSNAVSGYFIMLRETIATASLPLQVFLSGGVIHFRVRDINNIDICYITSTTNITDGNFYGFKVEYDATAGTASIIVNGIAEDDLGFGSRILTTGTIATDSTIHHLMWNYVGNSRLQGALGHCGLAYDTGYTYSNFFDVDNKPIEVDEILWTAWNSTQPAFWHKYAWWTDNKGYGGLASTGDVNSGSTVGYEGIIEYSKLGLPTIGDAIAADILTDKIAWVDGVRLVGTGSGAGQPSLVGLNIIAKSRDLTDVAWIVREDPVITYDQIGLEGAANTATKVHDNTSFHSGADQLAIPITGNVVTWRVFIKMEAGQPYGLMSLYCRPGVVYYMYNITDNDGSVSHGIVFGSSPTNVIWCKAKSVQYPGWWEFVIELPDIVGATFGVSLTPGRGSSYGANIGGVTGWNTYGNVEAYDGLRLWQVISQPAEFND